MRTPEQKYGTHLARRLLESYDGCDAGVRGAPITVKEADAYIERLVAIADAAVDAMPYFGSPHYGSDYEPFIRLRKAVKEWEENS